MAINDAHLEIRMPGELWSPASSTRPRRQGANKITSQPPTKAKITKYSGRAEREPITILRTAAESIAGSSTPKRDQYNAWAQTHPSNQQPANAGAGYCLLTGQAHTVYLKITSITAPQGNGTVNAHAIGIRRASEPSLASTKRMLLSS
jgi:hypothetical protein